MTDSAVKDQIKTIKEATKKASTSKASALRFLSDAGILTVMQESTSKKKK